MRACIYLFVWFCSCFVQANWDKQDSSTSLACSYQSTSLPNEEISQYNCGVNVSSTKLFNGFGLRANGNYQPTRFTDINTDTYHNYGVSIDSRLFLSSVTNFDIGISTADSTAVGNLQNTRFESSNDILIDQNSHSANAAFDFGKDTQLHRFTINYGFADSEQVYTESNRLFRANQAHSLSFDYSRRWTEDTHFRFNLNSLNNHVESANFQQDLSVVNALLGFSTRYLGNSQLEVLLGNSRQLEKDNRAGRNSFSWQVNNSLSLSDAVQLTLSTQKQITTTSEVAFNSSETQNHRIAFNWRVADNINYQLSLHQQRQKFTVNRYADSYNANNIIRIKVLDQVELITSITWQKLSGSDNYVSHGGINAGIQLRWQK